MKHIVKRNGSTEAYDAKKLYASIYTSCLSGHEPTAAAELAAQKVTNDIDAWLAKKAEVTADDIRKTAGEYLSELNPHAGYLYLHHHIMW